MNKSIRDKYIPVIGLEVHVQLQTNSKIFADDSTKYGDPPNTNISVITLGHPGVMPRINKKAIEFAMKMGIACGSSITRTQIFDRKNYFYPDLPKGYQITQDKTPICVGGVVKVRLKDNPSHAIHLNRIHLEEDAGKSMHQPNGGDSLVDLNRAGMPLIELVTEPDIRSSEEAYQFLIEILKIVRYLEICDGNMEEGSLRCDANISVMKADAGKFGNKVEIKNLNSFKNVQKAIEYETSRQIKALEEDEYIISETRTFDASTGKTTGMRTKEELNDYRYFPDPDLSPVIISEEWLTRIKNSMPELPETLMNRIIDEMGLPSYDASILTDTRELANYFFQACKVSENYKGVSNWIMGPVKSYLNEKNINILQFPVPAEKIGELVNIIDKGTVSHATASKEIFPEILCHPENQIIDIIQHKNLTSNIDSEEISRVIKEVLDSFPEKVQEYRKGKKGLIGLFMGEVMKKTKGKADPKSTNTLLLDALQ